MATDHTFELEGALVYHVFERIVSAERVFAGKYSSRKPEISSVTALQLLLKADSLLQPSNLCRQMPWSCADLFQTDRVSAAAALCAAGDFSCRKPEISSVTALQLLV